MRTTRLVYIAHPLGAGPDRAENIARASRWVAWAALAEGVLPVASWVILASVWDEATGRERGLHVGCQTLARCDEVWLVGGRVSPGMQIEREHAVLCGVQVVDMMHFGAEPPAVPGSPARPF